jgi:hypothetical protein
MALIDDIATYLQTNSVGTVGTDIFKSYVPDAANALVAVIDTGGMKPDIYIPTKEPTFQVFIRAATYSAGKTKLATIRSLLHQVQGSTIGSTYFYFIHAISEGGHLGRNERGLDEFSINFQCRTR